MSAVVLTPWEWSELVATDDDLPRSVVAVAARIALSMGAHDSGTVPLERLVRLTRYARSVVAAALRRLRADGWLDVLRPRSQGRATVYQITSPGLLTPAEVRSAGHQHGPEVRPSGPQGVSEVRPTGPQHLLRSGAADLRHLAEVRPSGPRGGSEVRPSGPLLGEERKEGEDPSYLPTTGRPPADVVAAVPAADVAYVVDRLPANLVPVSQLEAARYDLFVRQRLAAGIGWTPAGIVEVGRGCIETNIRSSRVGLWAAHVDRAGPPEPDVVVDLRPTPGKVHGPWCGQCDDRTRFREDDDGRPYVCPDCHHSGLRVALDA